MQPASLAFLKKMIKARTLLHSEVHVSSTLKCIRYRREVLFRWYLYILFAIQREYRTVYFLQNGCGIVEGFGIASPL